MSNRTLPLTDGLYRYLLDASLREPPLLRRLREETAKRPDARMQIAPEQGQLMQVLARTAGTRRALEIGVYTGYSSLCVALTLPEEGYLVACDVDAETTAVARRYWRAAGVERRVDLRLAPAVETLAALERAEASGTFDFAFVDADKENYGIYYERVLDLLRPGGLMLVDNVLWGGRVADPEAEDPETLAIRRLNERILRDDRVDMSMLPVADGLTLVRKRPRAEQD